MVTNNITYQSAATHFESYIGNDCYTEKHQQCCQIAVDAINTMTPQPCTLTRIKQNVFDVKCPKCAFVVFRAFFRPGDDWYGSHKQNLHCVQCGQALDFNQKPNMEKGV